MVYTHIWFIYSYMVSGHCSYLMMIIICFDTVTFSNIPFSNISIFIFDPLTEQSESNKPGGNGIKRITSHSSEVQDERLITGCRLGLYPRHFLFKGVLSLCWKYSQRILIPIDRAFIFVVKEFQW